MTAPRSALLVVGSPRGRRSTSWSLGSYLLEGLAARGVESEMVFAVAAAASPGRRGEIAAACGAADLVVVASPLYADSLPAPLVAVMETVAAGRKGTRADDGPRLAAVVNSGFPEASQSALALRICRRFAREAGFAWAGGLALGGGESIKGTPLAAAGGRARRPRRALDLAAAALAAGEAIPEEAVREMARPAMPVWLYTLVGGLGWRLDARRRGTARKLRARPYPQE